MRFIIVPIVILAAFGVTLYHETHPHYLPHRPMHEIDIQNNLRPNTETREGCEKAGGVVQTVPYTKLFLNCVR